MTKLLDDLLLLARIDSAAVDMPQQAFNLGATVGEVCDQMSSLAAMKDVQIRISGTDEAALTMGNEAAIRQLAVVLLDNAIKYSRSGGEVHVSVQTHEGQIRFAIADSGPGISEEDLPHIFQRFYRSPQAQHANPSGSGLGLALAANIAQMHGAEVKVSRSSMGGAVFSVDFRATVMPILAQLTE